MSELDWPCACDEPLLASKTSAGNSSGRATSAGDPEGSAALLAALRGAAATSQEAARAALRAAGVPGSGKVQCADLGQRSSTEAEHYEARPEKWTVEEGARRSQGEVAYRWRLPTGEERVHSLRADSASRQGVPAPWSAAVVLQHRLGQAAQEAQRQCRLAVKDRAARRHNTCS